MSLLFIVTNMGYIITIYSKKKYGYIIFIYSNNNVCISSLFIVIKMVVCNHNLQQQNWGFVIAIYKSVTNQLRDHYVYKSYKQSTYYQARRCCKMARECYQMTSQSTDHFVREPRLSILLKLINSKLFEQSDCFQNILCII